MNDKRAGLIDKLLNALPDALDSLIIEAKGGNAAAGKILLDHGMAFNSLAHMDSAEDQAKHVVKQALAGNISTNEAAKLMAIIEKRANIVELQSVLDRLAELESK